MIVLEILGYMVIAIIVSIFAIMAYFTFVKPFIAWSKTGFCRHYFTIHRTLDASQVHWHKCTKCGSERLMR